MYDRAALPQTKFEVFVVSVPDAYIVTGSKQLAPKDVWMAHPMRVFRKYIFEVFLLVAVCLVLLLLVLCVGGGVRACMRACVRAYVCVCV